MVKNEKGRGTTLGVEERYREFYCHWALKEAYIKAHGLGFGIELQDLSFFRRSRRQHRQNSSQNDGQNGGLQGRGRGQGALVEWGVLVSGVEPSPPWSFHVSRLDAHHVVSLPVC